MPLLTVSEKKPLAKGILELVLSPMSDTILPGFMAGAHVDLHLGDDFIRQYSLTNPSDAPEVYRLAIARDMKSRGGSEYVHDILSIGQEIKVSEPRNHFPLDEEARRHVFIAGGIGVTPVLAMVRQCEATGQDWHLIYATRSPDHCAYRDELLSYDKNVQFHYDSEAGGPLNVSQILPEQSVGTHIYCCGPEPMMHAVKNATEDWPQGHIHFEWFSADSQAKSSENEEFDVVLDSSGKRLTVSADKTLLEVLRNNGVPIASVCSEGICGTCETYVLSGEIDHRDNVLTPEEKESNEMMMVCCSRGRGEIVLDL